MARRAFLASYSGSCSRRLLDLPERLVGRVVGEDVHDEALLDGLPHRVQVEGLIDVRLGVELTEHLQGPALGRRGEREVGQVRLASAARAHRPCKCLLDRIDRFGEKTGVLRLGGCQLLLLTGSERKAKVLGSFARLGGMRLVDDDGVVAGRQRADLVQHERELLQRGDDDPRLFTGQRLGELAWSPCRSSRQLRGRARTGRSCPAADGRGSRGR